jgi:hypothetical protein
MPPNASANDPSAALDQGAARATFEQLIVENAEPPVAASTPAPEAPPIDEAAPASLEDRFRSGTITHDDVAAIQDRVTPDELIQLHGVAEANHLAVQARQLDRERPGWRAHQAELRQHGKALGFTDAELDLVRDRRAVRLLYDHWKQSQQPTSRPPRQRDARAVREAMTRLEKSGYQRDAASLIEGLLPD